MFSPGELSCLLAYIICMSYTYYRLSFTFPITKLLKLCIYDLKICFCFLSKSDLFDTVFFSLCRQKKKWPGKLLK